MRPRDKLAIFLAGLIGLTACSQYVAPETFSEQHLRRYLDAKEIVYEDICVQMGTSYWNLYAAEAEADLATPKERFRDIFANDALNKLVDEWYAKRATLQDPVLRRRVVVWHNILTAAKVEMDPEILSLKNRLEMWLTDTDTTAVRPSREELDSMMLELMKLRNAKAQLLGFSNFAELVLELSEIGAGWFYSLVATMDAVTAGPYVQITDEIKKEQDKTKIEFSDIRRLFGLYYATSQGAPITEDNMYSLMRDAIDSIGIDYDALDVVLVEQDLPGGVGGQSLAIRIPDNFKIVVGDELSFYDRMHELGHGLYYTFTTTKYPILKGYEWCLGSDCGAYSEGMAETVAKFVCNDEWQKKYVNVSKEDLMTQEVVIRKYLPLYLRFLLVRSMYEIELYKNLDQDPNELWQLLHEKYLLLEKQTIKPIPFANIISVSYPIYVQNYLIADIISWQIHQTLQDKFGIYYAFNRDIGQFLKDNFIKAGALYPWKDCLQRATGKELDVDGYLNSLVSVIRE